MVVIIRNDVEVDSNKQIMNCFKANYYQNYFSENTIDIWFIGYHRHFVWAVHQTICVFVFHT